MSIVMAFSSTANVLLSSHNLNKGQIFAQNNSDAMLICTGSKVKWISESSYFDLGKVVEVTLSNNIPIELQNIDCYSDQITEPSLDELFPPIILPDNLAIHYTKINEPTFAQLSAQFSSSLSRAPPTVLL